MSNAAKGFASLSPEKRKQVAALGGKAAHASGKAHKWTHEEAVLAGKKGRRKNVYADKVL